MSTQNAQQIEYWNGVVGEHWARLQEDIDRNLGRITQAFIPFAAARPGMRVLDIGCGCGTTSLTFARQVQPGGSVTGIDMSVPMLAVARSRAQAAGADIAFVEADASTYGFQPMFDLAASRFGVMFFADPVAAFANIRKSLAPGGRLAFVCWRSVPENGWAFTPITAARALLPPQETPDPHAPGPFAFADGKRWKKFLQAPGFATSLSRNSTPRWKWAPPPKTPHVMHSTSDRSRAPLQNSMKTRAKKSEPFFAAAMARYATPDGVSAPVACWFVSARG